MLTDLSCPDADSLLRFMLGLAPEPEADRIEEHLKNCTQCVALLPSLPIKDDLIAAVRAQQSSRDLPHSDEAERLLTRLRQVPHEPEARPDMTAMLGPAQAPGEIGRLGSFRLLKVLGEGGMGIVYEAEDSDLQRRVAVKIMKPIYAADESARERFLREARTMAAMTHDHIVAIHQVGVDRGMPFLVMPLLKGESLDVRLARKYQWTWPEVLRIGRELAEGLAAAHERGLTHRDIKPANIWLEAGGDRVKLLDFGLARTSKSDKQLTQPGAVVGTPEFMAPEQARGRVVDARGDLFSMGSVLYVLCTGRLPFRGDDTISTVLAVATDEPPAPNIVNRDVPPGLSALIMQLLAKDPADRPSSAAAVAERLRTLEVANSVAPSVQPPEPAAQSRPVQIAAGLLAAAFAALAGAGIWWVASQAIPAFVSPDQTQPAAGETLDASSLASKAIPPSSPPGKAPVKLLGKINPLVVTARAIAVGYWSIEDARKEVDSPAWEALIAKWLGEKFRARPLLAHGIDAAVSVYGNVGDHDPLWLIVINCERLIDVRDLYAGELPAPLSHLTIPYSKAAGWALCSLPSRQVVLGEEVQVKGYLDRLRDRRSYELSPELTAALQRVDRTAPAWLAAAIPDPVEHRKPRYWPGDWAKPYRDARTAALTWDHRQLTVSFGFREEKRLAALNGVFAKAQQKGPIGGNESSQLLSEMKIRAADGSLYLDASLRPEAMPLIPELLQQIAKAGQ